MDSKRNVLDVIYTHLSAIDFFTYGAQKTVLPAVMDQMAGAATV